MIIMDRSFFSLSAVVFSTRMLFSLTGGAGNANEIMVPFTTISRGISSRITAQSFLTIRTAQEWQDLWHKHASNSPTPPPLPAVDFSRKMVIAIFLGTKPTGGYGVEILRVKMSGDKLLALYKETVPPRGAMVTQVLTQPYHMIKIQQSSVEVIFQQERD